MNAIVFGGAGFLGSHVADALTAAGHAVTVFDRRSSTYLRADQRAIVGDISDVDAVGRAVDGHELVYVFAGLADIEEASSSPVETVRANILNSVHVLEAARQRQVKRVVFASTIYVFSDAGGFYRASKQATELFVEEYQRRYDLPYTILRYGTLYGRRADNRNSVHRYLRQALRERRIVAPGTGTEVREYIHVEDAARASVAILAPEFENQSVVLTGQQVMRLNDLLAMIREIVGADVELQLRAPDDAHGNPTGHYVITPYAFRPRTGRKLVSPYYVDLGQGLLDCLDEIYCQENES